MVKGSANGEEVRLLRVDVRLSRVIVDTREEADPIAHTMIRWEQLMDGWCRGKRDGECRCRGGALEQKDRRSVNAVPHRFEFDRIPFATPDCPLFCPLARPFPFQVIMTIIVIAVISSCSLHLLLLLQCCTVSTTDRSRPQQAFYSLIPWSGLVASRQLQAGNAEQTHRNRVQ